MGMGNMLMLAQVTFYLIAFILTFFIFVPLSVYKSQFDGHCILFADGQWNTSSKMHLDVHWTDPAYCNFPLVISLCTVPLSLFYVLWMSVYLFKVVDLSWLASFLVLITSVLSALLMLVSGIVLTTGMSKFCDLIRKQIMTCEDAQFVEFSIADDIYKKTFFVEFGMAQFGTWAAVVCWTALSGIAAYKLYTFHKQEDFFTSMRRERERLIQRVSSSRTENI